MNFQLSSHAQDALEEENIPFQVMKLVLEHPQQIVEEDELKVYQSQIDRGGKTQLLRVYVNDSVPPAIVVTVYATSNIRKYWRQA